MGQNPRVTAVFTTLTPKLSHFRVVSLTNGTKSGLSDLKSNVYPVPFRRKIGTVVGQLAIPEVTGTQGGEVLFCFQGGRVVQLRC